MTLVTIETLTKELNEHLISYHTEKNEIRNKVNEIRVEQNRLNLLMGQFADLNAKLANQAKDIFTLKEKVKNIESENYKTGEAIKELYQDQEDKPKRSWLDRFLGR